MNTSRYWDWLGLFALVAMFGSAFLLTKIAVNDVPPSMVVAGRIVVAALLLFVISSAKGERLSELKPYWFILFALALTGNCIPFFVIAWGQQRVDSGLAGILMAMMPLTTVVLAHFFIKEERITRNKIIGFVLGFIGVVILMYPELFVSRNMNWLYVLSMLSILFGAISYAANSVIAHALPKISLTLISTGVLLMASVIIVPLSLFEGVDWFEDASVASIWSVILLGIFPTGLATIIYFSVIRHAGAAFLSQINYLIPVWAVLMGVLFAAEKITVNAVVALIVILVGIGVAQYKIKSTQS